MRSIILLVFGAFCLCGCASTGPVPHLSQQKYEELVIAADQLALNGPPVAPAIANLKPLQVYQDHGNIVVALYRDAEVERGFYIVPNLSSYDPRLMPHPVWTFQAVNVNGATMDSIFEYSRTR